MEVKCAFIRQNYGNNLPASISLLPFFPVSTIADVVEKMFSAQYSRRHKFTNIFSTNFGMVLISITFLQFMQSSTLIYFIIIYLDCSLFWLELFALTQNSCVWKLAGAHNSHEGRSRWMWNRTLATHKTILDCLGSEQSLSQCNWQSSGNGKTIALWHIAAMYRPINFSKYRMAKGIERGGWEKGYNFISTHKLFGWCRFILAACLAIFLHTYCSPRSLFIVIASVFYCVCHDGWREDTPKCDIFIAFHCILFIYHPKSNRSIPAQQT